MGHLFVIKYKRTLIKPKIKINYFDYEHPFFLHVINHISTGSESGESNIDFDEEIVASYNIYINLKDNLKNN
ncbi:MAG: hypothetical protein HeimC3_02440 [Candidatus Heimdallarchaeota archaeon LC_3]|nr:MAG: hypothetical protein HeimC3_49530 [Candidatus Heimdallarchaeota archaeon LC_3]OLS27667.1 MAG: hypothetical protein HeimC3_02440 [Candidatus Heimdallarchaeota archaeon LC_3]